VISRSESYYNLYSLKTDALSDMAKTLLAQAQPERPVSEQELSDYDRKVLATFTTSDGRIKTFPMQERKFRVLLRHVLHSFSHGVRYTEKRVNEILSKYNDDTARLRRWLVDFGYMAGKAGQQVLASGREVSQRRERGIGAATTTSTTTPLCGYRGTRACPTG